MSFTRAFLKNNGLTDEQITAVMEEHVATLDPIKAERDKYKAGADQLAAAQQELEALKNGEDFKSKYEAEHQAFDEYKQQISREQETQRIKAAYTKLLTDEKIDTGIQELILKSTDFSGMKLDKDGAFENLQALKDAIDKDYGKYRVSTQERAAKPETPPRVDNGSDGSAIRQMAAKWHEAKYGKAKE